MEMDPTFDGYQSTTPDGHAFYVPWKNSQHQFMWLDLAPAHVKPCFANVRHFFYDHVGAPLLMDINQLTIPQKAMDPICSFFSYNWEKKNPEKWQIQSTFSLIASWTRSVSVETLKTISPVLASVSKKPTSCLSTASKYFFLSVLTCLSPVYIQHAISEEYLTHHQKIKVKN